MTENERIQKALATIIKATQSSNTSWIVGGSAGLMLRDLPLQSEPNDLDIYCDEEDIDSIYELLKAYATDEPTISVSEIYRSKLCHFTIHEVQVELVGGFHVSAYDCQYVTNVKGLLLAYAEQVELFDESLEVNIVPLAHELWFNALRGRKDRVQLIIEAFTDAPAIHENALQAIEAYNSLTATAKLSIRRWIREREAGEL